MAHTEEWKRTLAEYDRAVTQWQRDREAWKAGGKQGPPPKRPAMPEPPRPAGD